MQQCKSIRQCQQLDRKLDLGRGLRPFPFRRRVGGQQAVNWNFIRRVHDTGLDVLTLVAPIGKRHSSCITKAAVVMLLWRENFFYATPLEDCPAEELAFCLYLKHFRIPTYCTM